MLTREAEAPLIRREMDRFERWASSRLLAIELRRLGLRRDELGEAEHLLTGVALVPMGEEILVSADRVAPPNVATLDAIHLATALRIAEAGGLDAVMTYDRRLADGARHHGLTVLSPGQSARPSA